MCISESIYPIYYSLFERLAQAIEDHDPSESQRLLEDIETRLLISQDLAEKTQVRFFHNAFKQRLRSEPGEAENLYLLDDNGQQIKQFNFMAEKFPVVIQAQAIANSMFSEALREKNSFTFIDIGIGTAQQLIRLIKQLDDNKHKPKKVIVIGVEPSEPSLDTAQRNLEALSEELDVEIDFFKIPNTLENLSEHDWELLQRYAKNGPLFLNASFSLHHIHPIEIRQNLLKKLKTLNPALFMIIEPYSDHTIQNLVQRFRNAWQHYGLTFQAIDSIEAEETEKKNAKQVFFGREILDVIREKDRIEQFETAEMWLSKLNSAGFHTHPGIEQYSPLSFNQLINRQPAQHYIGINVGKYPIVSVIAVH
jgi:hypothetical protein